MSQHAGTYATTCKEPYVAVSKGLRTVRLRLTCKDVRLRVLQSRMLLIWPPRGSGHLLHSLSDHSARLCALL